MSTTPKPTQPITATPKPGTPSSNTPAPTAPGAAKPTLSNSAAANVARIGGRHGVPQKNNPRSTLDRQLRRATRPAYYAPLEITFLTGTLKGETLDLNPADRSLLGLAIMEVDQSQQANWPDRSEKGIRVGSQFDGVGARPFRFPVMFWSETDDVSQLVENLFILHEIQPDTSTPPTLLLRQGTVEADPCVCTEISVKYTDPFPGALKGFRRARVDLSFKLLGGAVSQHSMARPLGPSILQDIRQDQSQADRDRKGEAAVTERLLHPCLKDEAAKVEKLMLENELNAAGLSELSPNARVQLAIAGKIPGDTLQDPGFAAKLKEDLALVIAQNEDGVGKVTAETRRFAEAIATGKPDGLPERLAAVHGSARSAYDETLAAITTGNWDNKSPLFTNPELTRRLQNFGSCGLRLRAKGGEKAKESALNGGRSSGGQSSSQQTVLNRVNQLISEKSDSELKEIFGFKSNTDVRRLRGGAPYTTQKDFIDRMSKDKMSIAGVDAWKNVEDYVTKQSEEQPNDQTP